MRIKNLILLLSILSLLIVSGCSSGSGNNDTLAQCLTEKDVVMYGTEWCSHCQNQKKSFGSSFQYINFVDCDRSKEVCNNVGIRGYPTWIIEGESFSGEQSLERLAFLSGC